MPERTVEDRLREEYFELLPEIRRVIEHLEAEIRYRLLPIYRVLESFEQISVKARIKECDSAVESLRRRQEFAKFDPQKTYTLKELKDLAGVRVLAFPSGRVQEINIALRKVEMFENWIPDPVLGAEVGVLAFKYSGYCTAASRHVFGEYQIVSLLTGLFWEVEHGSIYKPPVHLRGVATSPEMRKRSGEVLRSRDEFRKRIRAPRPRRAFAQFLITLKRENYWHAGKYLRYRFQDRSK